MSSPSLMLCRNFFLVVFIADEANHEAEQDENRHISRIGHDAADQNDGGAHNREYWRDPTEERTGDDPFFFHADDFQIKDDIGQITEDNRDFADVSATQNRGFLGQIVQHHPHKGDCKGNLCGCRGQLALWIDPFYLSAVRQHIFFSERLRQTQHAHDYAVCYTQNSDQYKGKKRILQAGTGDSPATNVI